MLKLTVLQRYSENGRRICKILGEMIFGYSEGILTGDKRVPSKVTGTFLNKYYKEKEFINELFTSKLPLEEVFEKVEENGFKIKIVNFEDNGPERIQVVILIDE